MFSSALPPASHSAIPDVPISAFPSARPEDARGIIKSTLEAIGRLQANKQPDIGDLSSGFLSEVCWGLACLLACQSARVPS